MTAAWFLSEPTDEHVHVLERVGGSDVPVATVCGMSREHALRDAQRIVDGVRNVLTLQHLKARHRRFNDEPMTGFGED